MDLNGIAMLNDAVGGVTVTLEDDFSSHDPQMTKGATLTLRGKQTEYFVRSRMDIGSGTNEERMRRQQVYMAALMEQIDEGIRADQDYLGRLYDEMEPYLQTSMRRGYLINKAWAAREYAREVREIAGGHSIGPDGFVEFHADEASIKAIVLELFYQKVE